jgi:DNA-binding CsgD family transcriptional regulator
VFTGLIIGVSRIRGIAPFFIMSFATIILGEPVNGAGAGKEYEVQLFEEHSLDPAQPPEAIMSLNEPPNLRPTTSPLAPRSQAARLSVQESEILSHVLEGHTNAVIARQLAITEAAAKVRLKRLLRKIKVDNRTQATIWALANLPEFRDAWSFSDGSFNGPAHPCGRRR